MSNSVGVKLGVEGEQKFKASLRDINNTFRVLGSELKLVSSQFDKQDKSQAALAARNKVLNKEVDTQKSKVELLNSQLAKATENYGENSNQAKKYQTDLNNAKTALNKMESELEANNKALVSNADKYDALGVEIKDTVAELVKTRKEFGDNSTEAKALESKLKDLTKEQREAGQAADAEEKELADVTKSLGQYKRGTDDASGSTVNFGEKLKTAAKAAVGIITAVAGATSAAVVGLYKMAESVADTSKEINNTSQKLGLSRQGFQEWEYVLKKSGTSIDVMGIGMKTLQKTMGGLTEDGDNASKAFSAIGIKFEEIKGKTPEEALNMTIRALQDMPAGADRTTAALKLFGKGAMELQPLLNKTSEETEGLKQRAHDMGLILGDEQIDNGLKFKSAMGKITDTLNGLKLQLSSSLVPAFADALTAFLDFSNGAADGEAKMKTAIDGITAAVSDTIPQLVDKGSKMILGLVAGISAALPEIVGAIAPIIPQLVSMFSSLIPQLAEAAISALKAFVGAVFKYLPEILAQLTGASFKLMEALLKGLLGFIPGVVTKTGQLSAGFKVLATILGIAAAATIAYTLATNAKIKAFVADKAMTLALTALYAKDAVVKAASTVATIAHGAALAYNTAATAANTTAGGAFAVVAGIAAVAQHVWNAAMEANPIGAIIAAVALLIAGIAALVMWLGAESDEEKKVREDTEAMITANEDYIESIEERNKAYEESTKEIETQSKLSETLAGQLFNLVNATDKSAASNAKIKEICNQLNGSIEGLNLVYDENTGQLNKNEKAILGIIAAKNAEAKKQAISERSVELEKQLIELEGKRTEALALFNETTGASASLVDVVYGKEIQFGECKTNSTDVINKQIKAITDLNTEYNEQETRIGTLTAQQIEAAEAERVLMSDADIAREVSATKQAEIATLLADADTQKTDIMTENANRLGMSLDEYKEKLETTTAAATEMYTKLKDDVTMTVGEMQTNLEHNQAVVDTWSSNIATLAARGIDGGLLQQLRDAGPEAAGHVQALVNASDAELAKLSDTFANGSLEAVNAINKQFGLPTTINAGGVLIDDVAASAENNTALNDATSGAVQNAFDTALKKVADLPFKDVGINIIKGIMAGVDTQAPGLLQSIGKALDGAISGTKQKLGIHSPSTLMRDMFGINMAKGIGVGFTDEMRSVGKAMQYGLDNTLSNLNTDIGLSATLAPAVAGIRRAAVVGAYGGEYAGLSQSYDNRTNYSVTQNIYADRTSYADQQKQAMKQVKRMALGF